MKKVLGLALIAALVAPAAATAEVKITEYQYSGIEWVEFTNIGSSSVDMTDWSYSDDGDIAGEVPLSAFGVVAPGESVILAEETAEIFRLEWSLAETVKVIGENMVNLGRNDAIFLYDALGDVADTIDFGDADDGDFPGSIRANEASGNPGPGAVGTDDIYAWVLSSVGDAYGPYQSASLFVGNPGSFVPEPGSAILALVGLGVLIRRRRA